MDKFLSFVLILILGFYLLGIVARLLLRRWVARRQKEFSEGKTGGGFFWQYPPRGNNANRPGDNRESGKVTVVRTQREEKKVSSNAGEYVEYEEITETAEEEMKE